MRKLLAVLVALLCKVVLSSCSRIPFGPGGFYDDSNVRADAQMEKIAAALNEQTPRAARRAR